MTDRNQYAALATLQQLIVEPEGEHLEFKEARGEFHFEKLAKYCAALSNTRAVDRLSLVSRTDAHDAW